MISYELVIKESSDGYINFAMAPTRSYATKMEISIGRVVEIAVKAAVEHCLSNSQKGEMIEGEGVLASARKAIQATKES
jgi:hypothetical protein